MTVLVCLGPTPDTWWQAKNAIGLAVLVKAEQLAANQAAREAIVIGGAVQSLDLDDIAPPLKAQVWLAVERAAAEIATAPPVEVDWPPEWIAHVADLASEMEARRQSPGRPGAWPPPRA